MGGATNEPPRATIGSLVTLLVEETRAVLLTDARCVDALMLRIGRPGSVVAARDPIGRAILNRSAGERVEYLEGDRVIEAEILAVDLEGPVF